MQKTGRFASLASASAVALVLLSLSGCGSSDNLPREAISGSVAIDGKPLDSGLVMFLPDGADIATQGGASLVAGKYSIPRDQGLVPGKYKVAVSASDGGAETQVDNTNNAPGMPPIPRKEIIPKEFSTGTMLTAEVKAGGPNEFNFNLTRSKGK